MYVESPPEEPIDISINCVKICALRMARLWVNKHINDVIIQSSINSLPNFKHFFQEFN
jgi:hypothetical protein